MNTITDTTTVSPRGIAITLIIGSMIIPGIGLLGWLSNTLLFASFGIKNIPMAPSTALCFLLLSISLLLMFRPSLAKFQIIVITVLSSIVTLYGLLTFVGLKTGLPILPDNLFFPDLGALDGIPMGRMAPSTSILFAFSGLSLLFILATYNEAKQSCLLRFWANLSGGIVLLVGFLFFISYTINSPLFYGGETIPMALTTSITFILVGASLLIINSKSNTFNQLFKKLKDAKIATQLKIGFGAMMLLVAFLGYISYEQTNKIAQQTETMYNHPLQVGRALSDLRFNITAMHREMKDLFLPKSDIRMPVTLNKIELYESSAFDHIDFLYKWYLGPRSDIDTLKQNFIVWNSMREETIRLLREGKTTEAALRTIPGGFVGNQVEVVYRSIDKVVVFARNKGDSLHSTTQELNRSLNKQLLILVAAFLIILLLVSNFLIRAIKIPIDELSEAAVRFREGDLTARSSNTSKNEFGGLAASFNSLVDTIQANTEISNKVVVLTGKMLSEDDAKKFFQSTLQILMNQTGSQMAAAYLLSEDKKQYEHFESIGIDDDAKKSFSASGYEGEFGAAVTTHRIQHLKNIPETTRFLYNTVKGKFIPNEIITIPIVSGGEVFFIISLASVGVYEEPSIQLIEAIHVTYTARIEGILAYRRINDISSRLEEQNRELEIQQRELTAQSSELTEQNRELEVQKNQLSEANKLKTNFLSNMSHELRTPLNSVIALSGVLNRRLANKIPTEEYSYIDVIERNGKHLLELINDILDISRIEAGHEEIEITEFNANNLIEELIVLIQPQAEHKNIELLHLKKDASLSITSDANKCHHIIQNLIGNAVKFTEKGKVEVAATVVNNCIEIAVSDSGIGISESQLPHIFDEFRQADGSTSRRYGGTGLGLAIAKKYANLLGGNVTVKSTLNQGSVFTLILPLHFASENQVYETEPLTTDVFYPLSNATPKEVISGKTILLVEDSEPAIIQIKDMLESNGYHIMVARNGGEALDIIAKTIPDAMILDLMMPQINGFEVLKIIREAERTVLVPVLILTAKHITKDELKFLKQNNIHQLILKGDVNRNELLNALAAMVSPPQHVSVLPKEKSGNLQGKPTILVVEDNPDNMITVRALLANTCTIIEAVNGYESIAMAEQHKPNLILMDIALPDIDGIEAFKAIRNNAKLQHIPVIALTASAMTRDREAILAHGFDAYISKPIDEKIFFKIINQILYGK